MSARLAEPEVAPTPDLEQFRPCRIASLLRVHAQVREQLEALKLKPTSPTDRSVWGRELRSTRMRWFVLVLNLALCLLVSGVASAFVMWNVNEPFGWVVFVLLSLLTGFGQIWEFLHPED